MSEKLKIEYLRSGCDEIGKLFKFDKRVTRFLKSFVVKEISKYNKKDNPNDIEQNILEGLLKIINEKPKQKKYDEITERILSSRKKASIKNIELIKIISREINILKINKNTAFLSKIVENITSSVYGVREGKKNDVLKIYVEFTNNYANGEEIEKDSDLINSGAYDSDSEIDTEMKCLFDKFFRTLNERERNLFDRIYIDELTREEMLRNNMLKSEYEWKSLKNKTRNFFEEQLID